MVKKFLRASPFSVTVGLSFSQPDGYTNLRQRQRGTSNSRLPSCVTALQPCSTEGACTNMNSKFNSWIMHCRSSRKSNTALPFRQSREQNPIPFHTVPAQGKNPIQLKATPIFVGHCGCGAESVGRVHPKATVHMAAQVPC